MEHKRTSAEIDNMSVVINDIVMAVANHLRLPRERGYTVEVSDDPDPNRKTVAVRSKHWGNGSIMAFGIEYDTTLKLWYPSPEALELILGNSETLPEPVRNFGFLLLVTSKPPNHRLKWERGRYPRYNIRRIDSQKLHR